MEHEPLSILIIEDEAAARTSLCRALARRYPFFIIHSADSRSGVRSFLLHTPHIVVIELGVPITDGISMAEKLKSLNSDVLIIALTSYTDTKFLLMSLDVGIDHYLNYLQKPLVYERLYAVMDRNIGSISRTVHRKRMETMRQNELKLANELFERRVSERTADLEAAIRELESFSYSVSHDLRAPLRHINSFSSILIEEHGEELSGRVREHFDRICQASSKMGGLIEHLLELSKVTRKEINLEKVDLSELASSSLRMYKETEPERAVEDAMEKGIVVLGDHYLLKQLLDNLIGNAWKYTSKKPLGRIEFGTASAFGEKAYYVRDNGAGFDMEYREKLFQPFKRLHATDYEGIGIGLATAQRIIQRHDGRIWAEGSIDRGATFYFTLAANPAQGS